MGHGSGIREVAWLDMAGGGRVVLDGDHAYHRPHAAAARGSSVIDVKDPANPKVAASIDIPPGCIRTRCGCPTASCETASARAATSQPTEDFVGLRIFDVSKPGAPRDICHWQCAGSGVTPFHLRRPPLRPHLDRAGGLCRHHRHDPRPPGPDEAAGGRPLVDGRPVDRRRRTPGWKAKNCRCRGPIRRGDRLYVSYWYGGGVILDISGLTKPRLISGLDWSPPFGWPTHSLVPIDVPIAGHRWMLVADEHVQPLDPALSPQLPAMIWMVNITDETRPVPVSCFQLPELVGIETPLMTACHQPVETIVGNEVPAAWFANGLRVLDISNPLSMKQAAWWMPDVPPGEKRVSSNDVYVDHRGLIYLIDRNPRPVDPREGLGPAAAKRPLSSRAQRGTFNFGDIELPLPSDRCHPERSEGRP